MAGDAAAIVEHLIFLILTVVLVLIIAALMVRRHRLERTAAEEELQLLSGRAAGRSSLAPPGGKIHSITLAKNRHVDAPPPGDHKIVVWRCPSCAHLSRLQPMCDWCTTRRPDDAELRIVMNSTYMAQYDS